MSSFVTGFLAGLPLMMVIGPIAVLLWETGLERGLRGAWPAAIGVATADATFALTACLGGVALSRALAPFSAGMRVVAAAVLVVVAARLVRDARRELTDVGTGRVEPSLATVDRTRGSVGVLTRLPDAPRLTARFWLLTICNPLTIGLFASLVVAAGPAAGNLGWPAGIATASILAHSGYVIVGAAMGSGLSDRHAALMRLAGGVALAALALRWLLA